MPKLGIGETSDDSSSPLIRFLDAEMRVFMFDACNSHSLNSISLSGNGASLHSSPIAMDCCTPGKGISKSATVKTNLVGQKFSKLTVVGKTGRDWICKCECGNTCVKPTGRLRDSNRPNKSCGCLRSESIARASKAAWLVTTKFSHPHKEKLKWMISNMVKRCHKPGSRRYERYGGRGIQVCKEWRENRTAFFEWAVANGFDAGLSIERINRDGDYEPSNCRFATMKEQANNTCRNRFLTWNGETLTVAQWAEKLRVSNRALQHRVERKWSIERIFTQSFR